MIKVIESGKSYESNKIITNDLRTEIIRKSIHMLIALVPLIANINYMLAFFLLVGGILSYTTAEYFRIQGVHIIAVSSLTAAAARKRDEGSFVLGPVTLALGALLALLFYPYPAASLAIYALAFGDGLSSLTGKLYGTIKIPYTGGKTVLGSMTCLFTVFIISLRVSHGQILISVILAFTATIIEALPIKDYDNLLIPVGTGFVAELLL